MAMDIDPDAHAAANANAISIHSLTALQALTLDVDDAPRSSPQPTSPSTPHPPASKLTPFATSFLALPPELLTHILLYLAPDDLGVLSRVVAPLEGIERDRYLWAVWVHSVSCWVCCWVPARFPPRRLPGPHALWPLT